MSQTEAPSSACCELNWQHLVHSEIISVTSAMRKNSRWSGISVSGLSMASIEMAGGRRTPLRDLRPRGNDGYKSQSSPLMHGFTNLRAKLSLITDREKLDAHALLAPFLEVIKSGDTTGPITGAALASVEKFLIYGIIDMNSPNIAIAMSALSSAATHCKFEASDSVSDEVVLLKILQVLQITLTLPIGRVLSDEAVCEMMETGLSMCCQMRLSEMLRRSAEQAMRIMVQTLFERLKELGDDTDSIETDSTSDTKPPSPVPEQSSVTQSKSGEQQGSQPTYLEIPDQNKGTLGGSRITSSDDLKKQFRRSISLEQPLRVESLEPNLITDEEQSEVPVPYGLPSIRELLRVLISLLNPHDHQHTDSMRLMSLGILNVAFEVGGRSIGRFKSLRALVVDELCKYLFQIARTESLPLLTLTLRVTSTVFDTLRPYLKMQQELFLSYLIERLSPAVTRSLPFEAEFAGSPTIDDRAVSPSGNRALPDPRDYGRREAQPAQGEVRELLLEMLGQFARIPSFMVDLWVNYDCQLDCRDLFEEMIRFLCKNAFPDTNGYAARNSHMLCLDALLLFINFMVARIETTPSNLNTAAEKYPSSSELMKLKMHKRLLLEGAARFNENPKKGIEFLQSHGIIELDSSGDSTASLATFLKNTPRLNKKLLGEYLSKPSNIKVLKVFVQLFDFSEKRIDEALRDLLESFRLPGESQQIERIVEVFAETYFATHPKDIASQDATFILSYSVIMLNTDLHNPQVRRRMTLHDYMGNLRGVNDKNDFSPSYLQAIYEAIRKREIVMPEEHEGQLGFNYAWKELLRRAERTGNLIIVSTSIYDKDMFMLAWKPMVAAISYAFNNAYDDATLQKAVTGFHHCAVLAAHYELPDIFDAVITMLARMTGLLESTSANVTHVEVEADGQKVMVSDLSVQFGRNYKGQLAAVVAFAVANEHGNSLHEGWSSMMEIIKQLFLNSLLPSSMSQVEDFLAGTMTIPLKPPSAPSSPNPQSRRDGSLLSTLSSYLLSPYSSGYEPLRPEPTEEEVEAALCAVDCVMSCRLEELFADMKFLEQESLEFLMKACKQNATINSTTTKNTQPGSGNGRERRGGTPPQQRYDPAAVFFLEVMISITISSADRVHTLWNIMFEHLSDILRAADTHSILLVERAVVGLLRLCIRILQQEEMRPQLVSALNLLLGLPAEIRSNVAEQMMAGISNMIRADVDRKTGVSAWSSVFSLVANTAAHPEAAKFSFETVMLLLGDPPGINIVPENFVSCLDTLSSFADATVHSVKRKGSITSESGGPGGRRVIKASSGPLERASKSLDIIYMLHNRIPHFEITDGNAWDECWLPLLTSLARQCYNPSRELRQQALTLLQRALLLPELSQEDLPSGAVFESILFPLLNELLKPDIFPTDPYGADEARMRASALLCKTFLHHVPRMMGWSGLMKLWLRILDILYRYMRESGSDHLAEAVPESLKNMILVMYASGAFTDTLVVEEVEDVKQVAEEAGLVKTEAIQKPAGGTEKYNELWDITWKRIDAFLPDLRHELFPSPPESTSQPPKEDQSATIPLAEQGVLPAKESEVKELNEGELNYEKTDQSESKLPAPTAERETNEAAVEVQTVSKDLDLNAEITLISSPLDTEQK
ncbi:uncharacterized protein VTP21DRAFT_8900 [Calcarisporiella thermophila]|uniref:uncharacterized protein n=1 Tax=Calcarisporiella thermophila TaxID=911321 RepID=UPI00374382D1